MFTFTSIEMSNSGLSACQSVILISPSLNCQSREVVLVEEFQYIEIHDGTLLFFSFFFIRAIFFSFVN